MTIPAVKPLLQSLLLLASLSATSALAQDAGAAPAAPPPVHAEGTKLLEAAEELTRIGGDAHSVFYLQEDLGGRTVAREGRAYLRSEGEQFVMLITKPKTEAGGGYLRMDRNLWSYDPQLGRWDRRTERDALAGTNIRRTDLDERRYASEYHVTGMEAEKANGVTLTKLSLEAKDESAVPFPKLALWLDKDKVIRKQQEFGASGKLLRTTFVRKHTKLQSKLKGKPVLVATDVKIVDEVDKSRVTTLVIKSMDLKPLDANIFTKGYFEAKSR